MSPKNEQERKFLASLGRGIKFWRTVEGYNQSSFASAMDTSRSYVSRLETGNVGISIDRICYIADFLNIPPKSLLSGAPNEDEIEIIRDLYDSEEYDITRDELNDLFCTSYEGKNMTKEFYVNQLSILRSSIYTR